MLSEGQLPPPIPRKLSKEATKEQQRANAREYEKTRTDWQTLVLPSGVGIQGRFYQLTTEVDLGVLGLFPTPPRIEVVDRYFDLKGGDWVFVKKDSWESANPLRRGYGETYVLSEPWQEGQTPKIRTFDDHGFIRPYGYADHQGIIERQVIPQSSNQPAK